MPRGTATATSFGFGYVGPPPLQAECSGKWKIVDPGGKCNGRRMGERGGEKTFELSGEGCNIE